MNMRSSNSTRRYLQFCLVGLTGLFVDMTILYFLAGILGWNLSLSKTVAAEAAIVNNFIWNEVWTFRSSKTGFDSGKLGRLLKFNAVCLSGMLLSIVLLNIQVRELRENIVTANTVSIIIVSFWNYFINCQITWRSRKNRTCPTEPVSEGHSANS